MTSEPKYRALMSFGHEGKMVMPGDENLSFSDTEARLRKERGQIEPMGKAGKKPAKAQAGEDAG